MFVLDCIALFDRKKIIERTRDQRYERDKSKVINRRAGWRDNEMIMVAGYNRRDDKRRGNAISLIQL